MGLQVVKRNGDKEDVRFDAIQEKLTNLSVGLNTDWVDPGMLTKLVIEGLYDGVTTSELDELAAETAASLAAQHPDYSKLAARICVDNLHRSTKDVFTDVVSDLRNYVDPESGKHAPLISEEVLIILTNSLSSLAAITIKFGRVDKYVISKDPACVGPSAPTKPALSIANLTGKDCIATS